jgi:hypothetical protein
MRMTHDQLRTIIERYTPTMSEVVVPASADEISRLEAVAGPLPESYRDFLSWMGNRCLFLDGEQLAYSPEELLELVYEDPEIDVPEGLIWIGVDKSGAGASVYLRRADEAVVLIEYFDGMTARDAVPENSSMASYLLTAYVRRTLVPSHPFHFVAAFEGVDDQIQDMWGRVNEACSHFNISYPINKSDFQFYGGDDFVVALHQRPRSSIMYLYVGALERSRFEVWYDLAFGRWKLLRMPK